LDAKNTLFTKVYGAEPMAYEPMLKDYLAYADKLRPYVTDVSVAINDVFDAGKKVLFEGAQATFLDIDYGTYPIRNQLQSYCRQCCYRLPVSDPETLTHVVGVVKAYTTRVGEGPFRLRAL
jgi:adenylosuccinate synthase